MPPCAPPTLRQNGSLVYFVAPPLEKFPRLLHAFLTRLGGVSQGPYAQLNLGRNTGDGRGNVSKNLALVAQAFGFYLKALVLARQVHGAKVLQVKDTTQGRFRSSADALLTDKPGVALGVFTADCLPIVLYDPLAPAVGLVHAGWKGTLLGVIENAIRAMATGFKCHPASLVAAIGPGIGPCCYQVGQEVIRPYWHLRPELEAFFRKSLGEGYFCDLAGAARRLLEMAGLKADNISSLDCCTCCQEDLFYSYRRSPEACGRQLSLVMLR